MRTRTNQESDQHQQQQPSVRRNTNKREKRNDITDRDTIHDSKQGSDEWLESLIKDIQRQADEMREGRATTSTSITSLPKSNTKEYNKNIIHPNTIIENRDDSHTTCTTDYEYNLALQPMHSDLSSITDILSKYYGSVASLSSKKHPKNAKEAAQLMTKTLLNGGSIDSAIESVKSIIQIPAKESVDENSEDKGFRSANEPAVSKAAIESVKSIIQIPAKESVDENSEDMGFRSANEPDVSKGYQLPSPLRFNPSSPKNRNQNLDVSSGVSVPSSWRTLERVKKISTDKKEQTQSSRQENNDTSSVAKVKNLTTNQDKDKDKEEELHKWALIAVQAATGILSSGGSITSARAASAAILSAFSHHSNNDTTQSNKYKENKTNLLKAVLSEAIQSSPVSITSSNPSKDTKEEEQLTGVAILKACEEAIIRTETLNPYDSSTTSSTLDTTYDNNNITLVVNDTGDTLRSTSSIENISKMKHINHLNYEINHTIQTNTFKRKTLQKVKDGPGDLEERIVGKKQYNFAPHLQYKFQPHQHNEDDNCVDGTKHQHHIRMHNNSKLEPIKDTCSSDSSNVISVTSQAVPSRSMSPSKRPVVTSQSMSPSKRPVVMSRSMSPSKRPVVTSRSMSPSKRPAVPSRAMSPSKRDTISHSPKKDKTPTTTPNLNPTPQYTSTANKNIYEEKTDQQGIDIRECVTTTPTQEYCSCTTTSTDDVVHLTKYIYDTLTNVSYQTYITISNKVTDIYTVFIQEQKINQKGSATSSNGKPLDNPSSSDGRGIVTKCTCIPCFSTPCGRAKLSVTCIPQDV